MVWILSEYNYFGLVEMSFLKSIEDLGSRRIDYFSFIFLLGQKLFDLGEIRLCEFLRQMCPPGWVNPYSGRI